MVPHVEMLMALVAFYTLGFLWIVLPEPSWQRAEEPIRDR
jgi:hypothetical protein